VSGHNSVRTTYSTLWVYIIIIIKKVTIQVTPSLTVAGHLTKLNTDNV